MVPVRPRSPGDGRAGCLTAMSDTSDNPRAERLARVLDDVLRMAWTGSDPRPAMGAYVDLATGTVRIQSDELSDSDVAALADRYGPLVVVDRTKSPRRRTLPGSLG